MESFAFTMKVDQLSEVMDSTDILQYTITLSANDEQGQITGSLSLRTNDPEAHDFFTVGELFQAAFTPTGS